MIGGGCRVKAHSMPWVVRLAFKHSPYNVSGHHCGGTLISKNLVLTAAHCTGNTGIPYWPYMIAIVGDHDIERQDGEQIIKIEELIKPDRNTGIENP